MAVSLERRQDEVLQSKKTLAAVIDASPVSIVCSDLDRRIMLWNRAAEATFGHRTHFRSVRRRRPRPAVRVNQEKRDTTEVNQWAGSMERPAPAVSMRPASSSTDAAGGIPRSGFPPAPSTLKRSSWRHMTPLGIPVVPPV